MLSVCGILRLFRIPSEAWWSPGCLPGLFCLVFCLEWADAVAEFVG